ncbi:MFS transporter [Nocardia yunnanensis]|uniref:MFS transporter n=1 Tax=Nocardia yunnanensis TaxID=2382165 RepID=A0A386Z4M9_9NOCA|nr:MFS transporter [Nocardia yunnanensis]AYF72590.1 MFS transporter [Nocardia yunnanensis]
MSTHQRWTLALASVASLMVGLDALVVTTALNTIRVRLGASLEALGWTLHSYTLALAVLLLTAAALGDRFGRRRMLVAGLGLFTAASGACALCTDIGWLVAARTVQGVGAAMIMPAAFALVGVAFPPAQRGRAMGIFAGVLGLAILGGPVVGGAVVQGLTWQWIFWLNMPIGVALIPLVRRFVAESTGPAGGLDLVGVLLSGAGAAMPAIQNAAISAVGPESIGIASGVYNATRQLGGSLGIAVTSAVFTATGGYGSTMLVQHGFRAAVLAAAASAGLGALAGLGVVVRQHRPAPAVEPVAATA